MDDNYVQAVLELVIAVGSCDNEDAGRRAVEPRIELARDSHFVPAILRIREQLLQQRDAPPNVNAVIGWTLKAVHASLVAQPVSELGIGGICTALMTSNQEKEFDRDVERFRPFLDDAFFAQWDSMMEEFETHGMSGPLKDAHDRGDMIAFLLAEPRLEEMFLEMSQSSSIRSGVECLVDTMQKAGAWIARGCLPIERLARHTTDNPVRVERDLAMIDAVRTAREKIDGGMDRKMLVEELLDEQSVRKLVQIQWAIGKTNDSDEELLRVSARFGRNFHISTQLFLAKSDDDAKRVIAEEPALFSRQAENELDAYARSLAQQGHKERADQFLRAAERIRRWRDELLSPPNNVILRMCIRIEANELTLNQAIAELQRDAVLGELTVLHLGALDERIINLRDANELPQAETLAKLNHAAAQKIGSSKMIAYADLTLGEVGLSCGRPLEEIVPLLQQAREIGEELDDPRMQVRAYGILGMVYQHTGHYQESLPAYERAWAIAREHDLQDAEIASIDNLLGTYMALGDLPHAREMVDRALGLARERNDRESEYKVLGQKANVLYISGQIVESIPFYEESIRIAREYSDFSAETNILTGLAQAYTDTFHFGSAEDCHNQSLALARRSGNARLEGKALWGLGQIHFRQGLMRQASNNKEESSRLMHQALHHFQAAMPCLQKAHDSDGQALLLNNIARAKMALGEYSEAEKDYQESIKQVEDLRGQVIGESERIGFMAVDRFRPFTGLVKLLVLPGYLHVRQAWEMVERARSRAMVEQLARTPLLAGAHVRPEIKAQESALLRRIGAHAQSLRLQQGASLFALQGRLTTSSAWADAQRQLDVLAAALPEEYVELRKGKTISFSDLVNILS